LGTISINISKGGVTMDERKFNLYLDKLTSNKVSVDDVENLRLYCERKGLERYIRITEFLYEYDLASIEDVHDFYKYDIKLRRFFYKYITALEVELRARVINMDVMSYSDVEDLSFSVLVKKILGIYDLKDVIYIRNKTMHFRLLQLLNRNRICRGVETLFSKLPTQNDRNEFLDELNDISINNNLPHFTLTSEGRCRYEMGS